MGNTIQFNKGPHKPLPMLINGTFDNQAFLTCNECGHSLTVDQALIRRGVYVCLGSSGYMFQHPHPSDTEVASFGGVMPGSREPMMPVTEVRALLRGLLDWEREAASYHGRVVANILRWLSEHPENPEGGGGNDSNNAA